MKKILIYTVIVSLVAVLSGCSNQDVTPLNKEKAQTIVELEGKFNYELGKVLRDDVHVAYTRFVSGDEVVIVSEDSRFYYVEYKGLTLGLSKDDVSVAESQFNSDAANGKTGTVINDTDGIISIKNRGDEVKILERGDETTLIVDNGREVSVPSDAVRPESETYLDWYGYIGTKKVHIIDQTGDLYVIETDDGIEYVPMEKVSNLPNYPKPVVKPTEEPKEEAPTYNPTPSHGSSGSQGSSGQDGEAGSLGGSSSNGQDGEAGSLGGSGGSSGGGNNNSGSDESFIV